jgi:alkanesulfonate monooxygenase SsuD/methylene tetrahydromethanopterin reductase-like flavin-dependent oxidoreductase (luciferase family)
MSDLAVALADHTHPFEDLLALVRRAEALGYRAAYVDGDVSVRPSRGEGDVLDGWTATVGLLALTERIEIGSIRLVHHWNAARLAQAVATAERIAPGRLRFFASIGAKRNDLRFGLPMPGPRERIAWLDETLAALRALWSGETVTTHGRHVRLDGAWVRPLPRGGRMPIEVGGSRPALLEVVAARADRWDVNLPPVRERVERAARALARACAARGRDPAEIGRSMWIFTRLGPGPDDPEVRASFRRLNPWFGEVEDRELPEAMVTGSPGACRSRIRAIREELAIDLPVLDLSGLGRAACEEALDALAGS